MITGFVLLFLAAGIPAVLAWVFWPQIARFTRDLIAAWRFTGSCQAPPRVVPGGPRDGNGCMSYSEEGTWNEMRSRLEDERSRSTQWDS
ncbi:MAG: hypothetical protein WAL04_18855 [Acidimicrobiales bacterium]